MHKPYYHKEYDKWNLRHAHRPQYGGNLAGVVYVLYRGRGFTTVRFSEALVEDVGRALPFGVSKANPAYLRLVKVPRSNLWKLYAMYLSGDKGTLLVTYAGTPSWARKIRRVTNELKNCT